jgi:DNA polymerase III subunit delta'
LNKDKKLFLFTFGNCLFLAASASYTTMLFKEIIGQKNLKNRLIQTVRENRVSHAWLFFGPEGSGVLPLALALAQYILCTNRGETDACGVCHSCNMVNKYIHPDLHFTFPVNKTRDVDKDSPVVSDDFIADWRAFILSQPYGRVTQWYDAIDLENKQGIINTDESKRLAGKLNLKPFESEFKVAIIWQPEKMNDQASNKLLKLLEEPPPNTIFILAGENPDQLLTTIRSRCAQVKIPRISDSALFEALTEKHRVSGDKATDIVRLVSGNYLRALEILSEEEEAGSNFAQFRYMMQLCYGKKISELIKFADEMAVLTRERQKAFLEYGLRSIRENLALHFNSPGILYVTSDEQEFVSKFARFITGENVESIIYELSSAITDIERNGNGRMIFLDMVLKLSGLIKR